MTDVLYTAQTENPLEEMIREQADRMSAATAGLAEILQDLLGEDGAGTLA